MPSLVVVGTSLGGLQALSLLLASLPADFAAPLIIVQHRTKGPDSGLCDLLQSVCRLPVCEPEDKEPIRGGRVYLAPADYHLMVEPGTLALSTDAPLNHARPSIDVLFESAADAYGSEVLAVVLTGASADGARGALRVRQRGGKVLIQNPASAQSGIMPAAALQHTATTRSYSLEEVAQELIALCASPSPEREPEQASRRSPPR